MLIEVLYWAGILKIPWSEVVYTFDGIYLSWDPKMWKNYVVFHGLVFPTSGIELQFI